MTGTTRQGARDPGLKWRLLFGLPLLVVVLGLISDACMGFPLTRHARFPGRWLAGVLGLGGLWLLGEAGGTWITERDKTIHPLWRRTLSLGLLLLYAGLTLYMFWAIFKIAL